MIDHLQFHSLEEFLVMGGHGPYVWACFVIAVAIVTANWLALRLSRRRFLRAARARLRRQQPGAGAADALEEN